MFTDLFGGAPHAKVFDFLADEADRDRTVMEIARGAEVSRPTVYKVLDDFLDQKIVAETRTVGNSRFFQLDQQNETVRSLLQVVKPAEFADFELTPDDQQPARRKGSTRRPQRR